MAEKSTASDPNRARGRPKAWQDKTEQNTVKSLDRALSVLTRLGEMGEATLSTLSTAMDQSPATIYRVLTTFHGHGFVQFDDTRQVWSVGPGAFRTGAKFLRGSSLVERARPHLRRLMEVSEETANLGVARDMEVLFLSQSETHHAIRAFFPPGTLSPLHASGIGKALLAQWPARRVAAMLRARPPERFTEHTLVTPEALAADLAMVRERGYAFDAEEKNIGMRCIAAPVFDIFGEAVAGVSISGPVARVTDARIAELGALVRAAAAALTRDMGGEPP